MSNPTSSSPRGRGRGRNKELSASERVAQWVNQRETKRLNKEKWASRNEGSQSPTVDGDDGSETQTRSADVPESESSSDRSKGKRQNVKLYVPPSLRNRKATSDEPETDVKESSLIKSSDEEVHSETQFGISTQGNGRPGTVNADPSSGESTENVGIQISAVEASKPKGRGRGRKKPEQEIYVPRALRALKQENKSQPKARGEELKGGEDQKHAVSENFSDSGQQFQVQTESTLGPEKTNIGQQVMSQASNFDPTPENVSCESRSASNVPCDLISSSTFDRKIATKEMKHEPTNSTHSDSQETHSVKDFESMRNAGVDTEISDEPYTFEFYDPAVVAFMPSPQSVNPSCGHSNNPFFQNNAYTPPFQDLAPSQENYNRSNNVTDSDNSQQQCTRDHLLPFSAPGFSEYKQEESSGVRLQNDSSITDRATTLNGREVLESEVHDHCKQTHSVLSPEEDTIVTSVNSISNLNSGQDLPCETKEGCVEQDAQEENHKVQCSVSPVPQIESVVNDQCESWNSVQSQVFQPSETDATPIMSHVESGEESKSNSDKQPVEKLKETADVDDGDSWEALFDDNGDCLDESLVKELTEYVGKVEIDKPKINYLNYEPKVPELDLQAFSHIVEIYDFSPELSTRDLIAAFKDFASRGFDIKWIDDTHALGVFSSAIAANEALRMMHPLLKVRPMSEASKKGQSKARHCQEFLQPYKARPETTSVAARRLVAGALGMAPKISREAREQERKKLKEAKEKRRQERQQKNDMWDGTVGKCAMDEDAAS